MQISMLYHFFDRLFHRFIDLLEDFLTPKSGSQKKNFSVHNNNNKQQQQQTTDRFQVDLEVGRTLFKHLKMLLQFGKRSKICRKLDPVISLRTRLIKHLRLLIKRVLKDAPAAQ